MIQSAAAALRFGVEFSDGFDLISEEVDADGAVDLRGVDVEDAAAKGDLAGHFDYVHFGVPGGEEVLDEHIGHVLFADFKVEGQGAVEVTWKELHAGGFNWGDDEACLSGGDLPECGGAGLLDLRVGGEVFEG